MRFKDAIRLNGVVIFCRDAADTIVPPNNPCSHRRRSSVVEYSAPAACGMLM
jgi:hypothetical protein